MPDDGTSPPRAEREIALDAIRSAALVRVVIWHTFGAAVITYVVAAVPAMFFVTGSLLAQSLQRRPARQVLTDRLWRLLLPLAVYATVAFGVMAAAWVHDPSPATRVPWRGLWLWFFPLADPHGSPWTGNYLSSALWYLRALLWLLLLAPVLIRAVLRRPGATLGALVTVVFALDLVGRHPTWSIAALPDLVWQAGDLALYGIFLLLGALHRHGRFARWHRDRYAALAVIAGAAAFMWGTTQPVPLGVVNNSHPMHLFVGAAWLALVLAFVDVVERAARNEQVRPIISFLSRRSLTIYLWHPPAIYLAYRTIDRIGVRSTLSADVLLIFFVPCATSIGVILFGWVEDVAARRPPQVLPRRVTAHLPRRSPLLVRHQTTVFSAGLVVVLLAALPAPVRRPDPVSGSVAAARRAPVPSQAPPRPVFVAASEESSLPAPAIAAETPAAEGSEGNVPEVEPTEDRTLQVALAPDPLVAELDGIVRRWLAKWKVDGIEVGVLRPGSFIWTAGLGRTPTGQPLDYSSRFDIGSVTKTFTATLVLQLVDEGKLSLDDPLPELTRLPGFTAGRRLTVRNLLTHRTGLVNYRDTPDAVANPTAFRDTLDALRAVARQPLKFEPGTKVDYSSTNYLVLGLLIEQVTGSSFDTLVRQRFVEPYGLHITPSPPSPGNPNFSTSGFLATTEDLVRWMTALHNDRRLLSEASYALMADIDIESALGAGSFGYCPCVVQPDGRHVFAYIGHNGGTTIARWYRPYATAFVINLTRDVYGADMTQATEELFEQLRSQVVSFVTAQAAAS